MNNPPAIGNIGGTGMRSPLDSTGDCGEHGNAASVGSAWRRLGN